MAAKRPNIHFSPLNYSDTKKRFIDEVAELAGPKGLEQICNDQNMPPQYKAMLERVNGLLKCAAELLSENTVYEAIEEDRRQHTVILFGVSESNEAKQTMRFEEDEKLVKELLEDTGIEERPVSLVRMG